MIDNVEGPNDYLAWPQQINMVINNWRIVNSSRSALHVGRTCPGEDAGRCSSWVFFFFDFFRQVFDYMARLQRQTFCFFIIRIDSFLYFSGVGCPVQWNWLDLFYRRMQAPPHDLFLGMDQHEQDAMQVNVWNVTAMDLQKKTIEGGAVGSCTFFLTITCDSLKF
ncbi:hypothetical protein Mgra_00001190 [Meloidogyne graminicola]|uniref:Uncharacterized protein n=1 Tax=Meloidogyne graminicola TaxID=189291 RepID=A0A8T0A1Q1_9BILA|nr:hypothetical protein Mgra_00001190 [Meloidogyne graminicola]